MVREGTAPDALESVDSRRFLPHALLATAAVIALPAAVVLALSPLSGVPDMVLSALLATGLSVAAGSACARLWSRLPGSRELPFGDLMLWSWAGRVRAERRLARTWADGAADPTAELAALRRLSVVFEAREGASHGHSGRVARNAERIARRMGLPRGEARRVAAAAAVHDVGLLGVPRAILAKDGPLTPDERAVVERHAVDGAERVAAAAGPELAELVRHHHERYDGSGYPDGLAGERIPLGARILAVADRFDELASAGGPGRRGRRSALDELGARAGSELDPAVVAAFVAYYSGTRAIAGAALTATAPQRLARWVAAAPAGVGSASAPAVVQGVCAAGAVALAGSCLGGLPGGADRDGTPARAAETRSAERPSPAPSGRLAAAPKAVDDAPAPRSRSRGGGTGGEGGNADFDGPVARHGPSQPPSGVAPPAEPPAGDRGGAPRPVAGGGDAGGQPPVQPSAPTAPAPSPAPAPPPPAPTQVLEPVLDPVVDPVVDPVLDALGEAVPPAKPVTDGAKDLLDGLGGGGR